MRDSVRLRRDCLDHFEFNSSPARTMVARQLVSCFRSMRRTVLNDNEFFFATNTFWGRTCCDVSEFGFDACNNNFRSDACTDCRIE